ncbi:mucin-6 [Hyperolius riggenbachi]|uniref:mucin-6 n=1 Tax=Hyperolius riggenbachi TaxID=752182 RepID=UPI0035A3298F
MDNKPKKAKFPVYRLIQIKTFNLLTDMSAVGIQIPAAGYIQPGLSPNNKLNTSNPVEAEYDSSGNDYFVGGLGLGPANFSTCSNKGACSTWGNNHFFTFDNDLYEFSGTCNYVFATVCNTNSPEFNVQVQRSSASSITRIMIQIGAINVVVNGDTITILGRKINLPYTTSGIEIFKTGAITKLFAKQKGFELIVTWSGESNLMVEVDRNYMNRTCGLCGNFNRINKDEFVVNGKLLTPYQYANLQQIDDPNVICPPALPQLDTLNSNQYMTDCYNLLDQVSAMCMVSKIPFIKRCQQDLQQCDIPGDRNCACATLSEYSTRCALCSQPLSNWRTNNLCSLGTCPANQIYEECANPCSPTCSNPQYTCNANCVYGCFCPPGTVLDDLSSNNTCVPVSGCPCFSNGQIYNPGDFIRTDCSVCQCNAGQWNCTNTPCPGRCAVEGGSVVTTFDTSSYRFHGICTYVLVKSPNFPEGDTVMGVFEKCGVSSSETCFSSVIYSTMNGAIILSKEDHITVDGQTMPLPFTAGNITVIRQSSTTIILYTEFGLEIVVQRIPIFSAYIKVSRSFFGNTKGLCGNFNSETKDDFTSSSGIVEGTVTVFVDSWRAATNCKAAQNMDVNPCSMSMSNEIFAQAHCTVLLSKGTPFEACHSLVDPDPYYKRCVYEGCNYQETLNFICSELGSYARACASKGVMLNNWRASTNCNIACSGNQTYSYDTTPCGRTCLSLSNVELECYPNDIPIDGCNCPLGYYLNDKQKCVPKSQCPCYVNENTVIMPNQQTVLNGLTCYCVKGRLNCIGQPLDFAETCTAPKVMKTCGSLSDKFGAACAPTCQLLATGIRCVPTKCEAGCVCPAGTYEDLDGSCVPESECSCEYGGMLYRSGESMYGECQSCTCNGGHWQCEENLQCASTCMMYGESHIKTFDGQQYLFDGNCEYTLVTDGCGLNASESSFKIVTENVICGTTGSTCSRAITITVETTVLTLSDEKYTITQDAPNVDITVNNNTLFIIFDISIPDKFYISILWNKNMNLFIKILKLGKESVCGLCGNYNGNMKDDFETRSKYIASTQFEFINSWKDRPTCMDVEFAVEACSLNPKRKTWAESNCQILANDVFKPCHKLVPFTTYLDACVQDACGCDTGGDCECLCEAVAAYAAACLAAGVCIDWRRPDFCPVYCDYKNTHVETETGVGSILSPDVNCTWHYQPCQCPFVPHGYPHLNNEGCYQCGPTHYYEPDTKKCVPCVEPSSTTPGPTTTPLSTTSSATSTSHSTTPTSSTGWYPIYHPFPNSDMMKFQKHHPANSHHL